MRRILGVLVVVGAWAAGAAPTDASTVSGSYYPSSGSCCESRAIVSYVAAPGERNDLTVSRSPSLAFPLPGSVGLGDLGAPITAFPLPVIDAPAIVGGFQPIGLLCAPLLVHVTCFTNATVVQINVALGDGHDRATAAPAQPGITDCGVSPCFSIAWDGGTGDDIIFGSRGIDVVDGGDGRDTIDPNGGADVVRGGNEDDTVLLAVDGAPDRVFCGAGADTVQRSAVDPLDTIDADCEVVGP